MVQRKVIKIDESLCNGCGNCVIACAEGAIELIDGKARVVSDMFCDGLGACLGECPTGALTIEKRDTEEFDEKAAKEHLKSGKSVVHFPKKEIEIETESDKRQAHPATAQDSHISKMLKVFLPKLGPSSQLSSWPIQMSLAPADAPYFRNSSLLIAADCSAFACPNVPDFIKGKVVLIGCPMLNETTSFVDKLTEILQRNDILDITVLHMEVPCCSLVQLVSKAINRSGKQIPLSQYICMIGGDVAKEDKAIQPPQENSSV
jgi:NAD-dependent dihydropyrimidine dehydrogenase PreA subunit